MAPTITTRCLTKGCDHPVALSCESDDGPATGECTGCGAGWRLVEGRLHRLAAPARRPALL